jgi:hypothetical protein
MPRSLTEALTRRKQYAGEAASQSPPPPRMLALWMLSLHLKMPEDKEILRNLLLRMVAKL